MKLFIQESLIIAVGCSGRWLATTLVVHYMGTSLNIAVEPPLGRQRGTFFFHRYFHQKNFSLFPPFFLSCHLCFLKNSCLNPKINFFQFYPFHFPFYIPTLSSWKASWIRNCLKRPYFHRSDHRLSVPTLLYLEKGYLYCHNPNSTQSWVWHENDFRPPTTTTHHHHHKLNAINISVVPDLILTKL